VAEVMRVLRGEARGPILELSAALGGVLLAGAGLAQDVQAGADTIQRAVSDGAAAERFGRMLAALGGPVSFVEDWARFLPEATVIRQVKAPRAGHVAAIDGEALGLAVVALGGGRRVESDRIDPAVGLSEVVRLGTRVAAGETLAVVHASRSDQADAALAAVQAAITLSDEAPEVPELILERVD
jgi:thymidine phosphorylase